MKKLLGILTLTLMVTLSFNVASSERPEIRKINAKVLEIKAISSTHCDDLGEYKNMCEKDLKQKITKQIKKFNTQYINDKLNKANSEIGAVMAEEKSLSKFRSLLDESGVAYTNDENSNSLKKKYRDYKAAQLELACVTENKNYIDVNCNGSITYDGDDNCKSLTEKLALANYCSAP